MRKGRRSAERLSDWPELGFVSKAGEGDTEGDTMTGP
jgi:hypothetical protein